MFENIKGNDFKKELLKNELKQKKQAGTYLFYGRKGADLFEFALAFTKGLNCQELENDFCDTCRICNNINKKIYSDLHILSGVESTIKINEIRTLIKDACESTYEGHSKVFIIEGINKLRKESANALLKIIEEPPKNTYFILLSYSDNILATIKSRSISLEIKCLNHKELDVSKEVYNFFLGNTVDIKEFKKSNLKIDDDSTYKDLTIYVENYLENKLLENKIKIFNCIEDFVKNFYFINETEKIKLAESLDNLIGKDREFLEEFLYFFIFKMNNKKNLEKLLKIKEAIHYNVGTNLCLVNFFLNL